MKTHHVSRVRLKGNEMLRTTKLAVALSVLSMDRIEELANTLVHMDEGQAERIKNAIAIAQQERDLNELELQKQHEFMHRADEQYYGEVQ